MAGFSAASSCWQGREQHGQPVAALAPMITTQRPPGVAEAYQRNPPVFGVVDPGHQALPLQPLNHLGHRRLTDARRRGQCRHPEGSFLIKRAQRQDRGQVRCCTIGQVPHNQHRRLLEPLGSVVSGVGAI
jgi:hypothetical protein